MHHSPMAKKSVGRGVTWSYLSWDLGLVFMVKKKDDANGAEAPSASLDAPKP